MGSLMMMICKYYSVLICGYASGSKVGGITSRLTYYPQIP